MSGISGEKFFWQNVKKSNLEAKQQIRFTCAQGEQTGRIFAHFSACLLAAVFMKMTEVAHNFGLLLLTAKVMH
jgi:hypothetical protein